MTSKNLSRALAQWRTVLKKQHVLSASAEIQPYYLNISALDNRGISAVLKPGNTRQVQKIVQIANRYRIPLYPLSCGRNWGYGSRLPSCDGAVIVDLSRMNRIRNKDKISVNDHYALIEPGVTQEQLQTTLERSGLPLLFNATAAGSRTSILGNSLDRGFGYFAMRPEDISGLEVVLGNGEILRTGYGHYRNARSTYHYKYGIGPSLDGLFFQSNFGIVTCAAFHLLPRRECHVALLAKLQRDEDFPKFIDALAELRRQCILESVVHIGNRNRIRTTMGPLLYNYLVSQGVKPGPDLRQRSEILLAQEKFGPWSAVGGVFGTKVQVKEALRKIKKQLKGIATVGTITPEMIEKQSVAVSGGLNSKGIPKGAVVQAAKPLMDFSLGIPSDGAQLSALWTIGESPDKEIDDLDPTSVGLLFCPPALPLDGSVTLEVLNCVDRVFGRFGFIPYITLNIVNSKTLLCVLNLTFKRNDPKRAAAAHQCVKVLWNEFAKRGFYPYRLGIQSMTQFVDSKDIFWKTVRDLKQALDPNHIIAPNRYSLI